MTKTNNTIPHWCQNTEPHEYHTVIMKGFGELYCKGVAKFFPKAYTREDLIQICEDAVVAQKDWGDRDTPRSQAKVGYAWAMLKAGCDWVLAQDPEQTKDTIWIEITHLTFDSFENGRDDLDSLHTELIYLPTRERLERCQGRDWY